MDRETKALGRPPALLNVRALLEHMEESITTMLKYNARGSASEGALCLPPIYVEDLRQQLLLIQAILRKNASKRKDIYVNRKID